MRSGVSANILQLFTCRYSEFALVRIAVALTVAPLNRHFLHQCDLFA